MMRITDINCMIGTWPSRQKQYEKAGELLSDLDRDRITDCIAFHSMALWSPERGNALIREASAGSMDRIKPCYILEPTLGSSLMPSADILYMRLMEEKPVAVRLYPNMKQFRVDDFYCGELLEVLNDLKMPVIFEPDQALGFDCLPSLAREYPGICFILLRHGFRQSRYIIPLLKKLSNVYFETSAMVDTGLIEEIVNKYGSEKLLFGSGLPFFTPAGALSLVLYARIGDEDRENILYKNWLRIEGGIQCK